MVAQLSAQDIQGAKFRERVRAAGGDVIGDSAVDRETLRRAGVDLEKRKGDDRPGYIEIDVADGAREIVIRDRDGVATTLHPMLSYRAAKALPFYLRQLRKLQAEMDACDDEDAFLELRDRQLEWDEKLTRLSIPDLPAGFLSRIEYDVLEQLQAANERLAQRVESSGPNAASRGGQSSKATS